MADLNIDIDDAMYMKYIDYRNNAAAEGAEPMRFSSWKKTPIAQSYLQRLSQATVNGWPGLSGAVVDGNVWWVNVGKEG